MGLSERFPVGLKKTGKKYSGKYQTVVGGTVLDHGAAVSFDRTMNVAYRGDKNGNKCPMERVMAELRAFDTTNSANAFTSVRHIPLPEDHSARGLGHNMRLSLKMYSLPKLDAEEERKAIRRAGTGEDKYI